MEWPVSLCIVMLCSMAVWYCIHALQRSLAQCISALCSIAVWCCSHALQRSIALCIAALCGTAVSLCAAVLCAKACASNGTPRHGRRQGIFQSMCLLSFVPATTNPGPQYFSFSLGEGDARHFEPTYT
eukprot:1158611-Pelagomonas_calceolata.AAC.3